MNDEVKMRLLKYFDILEGSVKNAADLAKTEIPDIIQEWISWEFYSSVTLALFFFSMIIGLLCLSKKVINLCFTYEFHYKEDKNAARFLSIGIPLFISSLLFWGCCYNSYYAIKIKIAPKVVILEKITSLIKNR